jgi:hypothetical protein
MKANCWQWLGVAKAAGLNHRCDDVTATVAPLATHVQKALAWTADNPDLTPANAVR